MLDLDSSVFTCFTLGYYQVSFSLYAAAGPIYSSADLYLYKNGKKLPESRWFFLVGPQINDNIEATSSRILASNLLEMFVWKLPNVKSTILQILHMDAGDALELRMETGDYISKITLNIELIGLGFDYVV